MRVQGDKNVTSIIDQIWASELKLSEIPELKELLSKADYINSTMTLVKKALQMDNPPLWMVLSQVCTFLKGSNQINGILRTECERGFLETEEYNSFIFTYGLYIFLEYTKLNANVNHSEGVNG